MGRGGDFERILSKVNWGGKTHLYCGWQCSIYGLESWREGRLSPSIQLLLFPSCRCDEQLPHAPLLCFHHRDELPLGGKPESTLSPSRCFCEIFGRSSGKDKQSSPLGQWQAMYTMDEFFCFSKEDKLPFFSGRKCIVSMTFIKQVQVTFRMNSCLGMSTPECYSVFQPPCPQPMAVSSSPLCADIYSAGPSGWRASLFVAPDRSLNSSSDTCLPQNSLSEIFKQRPPLIS